MESSDVRMIWESANELERRFCRSVDVPTASIQFLGKNNTIAIIKTELAGGGIGAEERGRARRGDEVRVDSVDTAACGGGGRRRRRIHNNLPDSESEERMIRKRER
jgi:hypothetical protein